jgi:hypothetical protein
MRTTSFVDCSRVQLPSYERRLCPPEPVDQRLDPTQYGWHSEASKHNDRPGMTNDEVLHDFAVRAIRAQPGAYGAVVLRDFALGFYPERTDRFGYDTAFKWTLRSYLHYKTTDYTRPAYAAHGGEQPHTRQPLANVMATYGDKAYLPGPVLLALSVLSVLGLVLRRPHDGRPSRSLIFLLLVTGLGLVLATDVTAEFVWRYQLPALLLVPMAAALAWTRLGWGEWLTDRMWRRGRQPGTTATPSTD